MKDTADTESLIVEMLIIIPIILKMVGTVNWPWILVLAPVWICISIFILFVVCAVVSGKTTERKRHR